MLLFKKYFYILFIGLSIVLNSQYSYAQSKTEVDLINKIVSSLQKQDSFAYAQIFPSADTMMRITLRKAPSNSDAYLRSKYLIESPSLLQYQDTLIQKQACELFNGLIQKSKKYAINWEAVLMNRYELEALGKSRDAALEAIASERFVGYLFIEDMLTRKIYALSLSDIMKIEGKWYGGELNHIFVADSKDAFNAKLKAEKIRIRKGLPDTTEQKNDSLSKSQEEEEPTNKRKQVVDRKLYVGMLDGETPVSLYIRYIKGGCPEGICSWEAIFKFGDNDYAKQEVSKTEDGKWMFVEQETGGVMELTLKGDTFVGIFSATLDKVDYDAELKEKGMTKKKMESLDALIEKDLVR